MIPVRKSAPSDLLTSTWGATLVLMLAITSTRLDGQARPATSPGLAQLLAYSASEPRVTVSSSIAEAGITVDDLTFASVAGNPTIQAYLIRPTTLSTSHPGVLFVHWFAPPVAQPGVDPGRIAYVGHDYGAMFGAVISAVDSRPQAFVIIAAASRFSNWYLFGSSTGVPAGSAREAFLAQPAPIEPVNTIGTAKASFFFQFGESDRYTPRDDFIALYLAAPTPKRIATYASDHDMVAGTIRHDRTAWLAEQLGFPPDSPVR